jgi:hypothetical protein
MHWIFPQNCSRIVRLLLPIFSMEVLSMSPSLPLFYETMVKI